MPVNRLTSRPRREPPRRRRSVNRRVPAKEQFGKPAAREAAHVAGWCVLADEAHANGQALLDLAADLRRRTLLATE